LAGNVRRGLDWLDQELLGRKFLVKEEVTSADTMMLFDIQFIFAKDLCGRRRISDWRNVEKWVRTCEGTESYKRAVEKTGYQL
jgi:glutathione S-transferase